MPIGLFDNDGDRVGSATGTVWRNERGMTVLSVDEHVEAHWQIAFQDSRALAAEAHRDRLREKLGEAEVLLGSSGGAAAGLVPAIHNLTHRAEAAEARVEELEAKVRELLPAASLVRQALVQGFVPDGKGDVTGPHLAEAEVWAALDVALNREERDDG